jgi:hypothetical protein
MAVFMDRCDPNRFGIIFLCVAGKERRGGPAPVRGGDYQHSPREDMGFSSMPGNISKIAKFSF